MFFKLKSDALADQVATGEAIMRVSKSAFKDTATSELKKFNDDTRGWLHANGYRYDGPGAGPNGWWTAHKLRFQIGLRYRGGLPFAPGALVEHLASEKTPRTIRQLAYEELVIRYGADIAFETDMPVRQQ